MSEATQQVSETIDNQCVTFYLDSQLFGLPVTYVREIFTEHDITPIPLSPPEVKGAINLRGRVVTVIDLRTKLNLPSPPEEISSKNIAVEYEGELYSLLVDSVGEVLTLSHDTYEHNPGTLDQRWRKISSGIHKLKKELLVMVNVDQLIVSNT